MRDVASQEGKLNTAKGMGSWLGSHICRETTIFLG